MSKTILITMLAITTAASAKPYFAALPPRSLYGSLIPPSYASTLVQPALSPLVQESVPAVVPGAVSTVLPGAVPAAAYTNQDLTNYAYSDYSSLYGVPNFATLASPYSVPQYGYSYGNYIYRR